MKRNWPRDRYSGVGGGLSTVEGRGLYPFDGGGADHFNGGGLDRFNGGGLDRFNGGGLDPFNKGGLDSSPGGGLYTGRCDEPYMSCMPPIDVFVKELRARGYTAEADEITKEHGLD
ncbi:hypothetical protein [Rathayibacter tanaceti]|uniref:Uncharacterized protein n=2 Tax=Rathayibacter tanaceti TaxID=1671680 RepID=A0A162IZ96_9MICO|nr:hypothetical protein [Rathayibacter tanaceti]KZX19947.1 hypothetical protein ACH61_02951 [Rathayibacter tanaceti]QHC56328.1 hypothetical protein GSU10_12250 [Rathayibacter tanaceti]TCO34851.1 hypothetical protein EV639_1103 [Rathayibacter tanaceti]